MSETRNLEGLGGWLFLVGLGLVIAPLHLAARLHRIRLVSHRLRAGCTGDGLQRGGGLVRRVKPVLNHRRIQRTAHPAPAAIQHMRVNHGGGNILVPQ